MKIGVIGLENNGLSFSLLCEGKGYSVMVSDEREDLIYNLNQKICLGCEPNLQRMLFETNNFTATTSNVEVIQHSDIIFTFVSSPINVNGNYDTTNLFNVTGDFFSSSSLDIPIYEKKFVVSCPTNPGEVEQIQKKLSMFNIQVAYNPEFISKNEILLIGTEYPSLANDIIEIYRKIQSPSVNSYVMSPKAAELTKIGINSFVATKISYANMMGDLMIKMGLKDEVDIILNAIGGDSRIGKKSLKYGFGYGGETLPKDIKILDILSTNFELESNLSSSIISSNENHSEFLKKYFIKINQDKSIPFVMTNVLDESQEFKLCVDLLTDGYYLNIITNNISKKINSLNELYNNRVKFFKQGTNPEGVLIKL